MTFEEFMATRLTSLLILGTAMSGDAGLAEDLVQDVLIKAHRRWSKIEKLEFPYSYVRRMVVNEYISWHRRWSRVVPMAHIELTDDAPDEATTHADRDALRAQLARLPRRQRAVLALRYFGGLSDPEIAEALGCGQVTVRSYASRALAALREQPSALLTTNRGTAS